MQQCINSIDRALLNERLLDEASANDAIALHFQHKLSTADFDKQILTFDSTASGSAERIEATFDLCIGADGSYSNVRRQLMRVVSYVARNFRRHLRPLRLIAYPMSVWTISRNTSRMVMLNCASQRVRAPLL